jgi:hypothetical protein
VERVSVVDPFDPVAEGDVGGCPEAGGSCHKTRLSLWPRPIRPKHCPNTPCDHSARHVVLAGEPARAAPRLLVAAVEVDNGRIGELSAAESRLSMVTPSPDATATHDPRTPGPSTVTTSSGLIPGTVTPQRIPAPNKFNKVATTRAEAVGQIFGIAAPQPERGRLPAHATCVPLADGWPRSSRPSRGREQSEPAGEYDAKQADEVAAMRVAVPQAR